MPTETTVPLPLPHPTAPFLDQHGRLSREWFEYFVSIDRLIRALRDEIP